MVGFFNVLLLCALATAMVVPAGPLDLSKRTSLGIIAGDLTNNDYLKYYVNVTVGSEGEVFRVVADSGSTLFWVSNKNNWTQKSTSFVNSTEVFLNGYISSSLERGYFANDSLKFSDGSTNTVKLGVIDHSSNGQGILGLGLQEDSKVPVATQLKQAGAIDHNVVSMYFNPKRNKGKLIIGGYDQAKVGSPWSVHSNKGQLKVPITNVTVDDKTHYPDHGDYPIVVDTGAGHTYLPQAIVKPIVALFNNPQVSGKYYTVDCNIPDRLFQLGFGNLILDIPLKDIVLPHDDGATTCNISLTSAELNENLTLIGGAILDHVVVVFDYDNVEIKVANLKDTDEEDIVKP